MWALSNHRDPTEESECRPWSHDRGENCLEDKWTLRVHCQFIGASKRPDCIVEKLYEIYMRV